MGLSKVCRVRLPNDPCGHHPPIEADPRVASVATKLGEWGFFPGRTGRGIADKSFGEFRDTVDYQEGVLNIRATVSVTLARKKISVQDIVNLVPGSMLNFDIHCDQPLQLEVAGTPIGSGETVKIGDKFGLRVREIGSPKDDD